MLTIDPAILTPGAARTAAISAAFTAAGLTPGDYTTQRTALKARLDAVLPATAPERTDELIGALVTLVVDEAVNNAKNAKTRVTGLQAAIADIATADAVGDVGAGALANAIKAKVNTLLAELRTAGALAP